MIFLAASAVRLATIWCGTNVDEGVYWVEGRQIRDGYLIYRDTQFNKTPMVCLVSAAFFLLGETPIYVMRVCMVGLSLLGLWVIYLLAKELYGQIAAVAAAVLIALEPFSSVWAKYLHTSSWAPWFDAAVFLSLISGLRQSRRDKITASGVMLGIYALTKQSAAYVVIPAVAAWLLFAPERNTRALVRDAVTWVGGILLVLGPFCIFMAACGAFDEMWFDIWTAHHLMASAFAHHTLSFRFGEFRSIVYLSPLFWLLPLGSLLALRKAQRCATLFVWIWLATDFVGNVFLLSHLWRHYILVCMAPAAILSGAFWQGLVEWAGARLPRRRSGRPDSAPLWATTALLTIGMVIWWSRNDWTYPGLSLSQERKLAAYVAQFCPEPYLLNLTNPALYVWTGKQIPPAYRDGRLTRIPFFMTIAGRGYLDRDDMERTVEHWRDMRIGCVVAYDKFVRQILQDPLMKPLLAWLNEDFQFDSPRRIAVGKTYYGWFLLFERKGSQT